MMSWKTDSGNFLASTGLKFERSILFRITWMICLKAKINKAAISGKITSAVEKFQWVRTVFVIEEIVRSSAWKSMDRVKLKSKWYLLLVRQSTRKTFLQCRWQVVRTMDPCHIPLSKRMVVDKWLFLNSFRCFNWIELFEWKLIF